jgi:hypothetical protein
MNPKGENLSCISVESLSPGKALPVSWVLALTSVLTAFDRDLGLLLYIGP